MPNYFTARAMLTVAATLTTAVIGCGETSSHQSPDEGERTLVTTTVRHEDMISTVTNSGRVEPVREVVIKSKASGEILRFPVEIGDVVSAGALLAQVDTTEAATQVRQTSADLAYQRAQLRVASRRLEQANQLFDRGMISQDDLDEAELEAARVRSQIIRTEAALENARERLRETVVRAPIDGTVLEKDVEAGQVISSAMSGVSEGTTLLTMADLTALQVRVLADQSDLGKIQPGQEATITPEAFGNRSFSGRVTKIEPYPERKRDVTYFPVLIDIDNREGALLPGMDCRARIHVRRIQNALVVSTDAVVPLDEAEKVAPLLDIPQDTVAAAIVAAGGTPTGETEVTSTRSSIPPWIRERLGHVGREPAGPRDAAIVFVVDSASSAIRPTPIRYGSQDWDVTQIVAGLDDGTTVLIPPSAMVAQQFKDFREQLDRFRANLPGRK